LSVRLREVKNIKFFQPLSTINKIADKGEHTFVIGDLQHG